MKLVGGCLDQQRAFHQLKVLILSQGFSSVVAFTLIECFPSVESLYAGRGLITVGAIEGMDLGGA